MMNFCTRATVALCTAFGLMAAGCGENNANFKYQKIETDNDTVKMTLKRVNDDASLEIQMLKPASAPEVFEYSCSKDLAAIEAAGTKALEEQNRITAEMNAAILKIDLNKIDPVAEMAKMAPLADKLNISRLKATGFQDLALLCRTIS